MDTFFKHLSCFLFLVLFSTCSQIQARDSRFFAKYVHISHNTDNIDKNYVTVPSTVQHSTPNPTLAPSPSPVASQIGSAPSPLSKEIGEVPVSAPTPVESTENVYYGLYGKGGSTDEFPSQITAAKTEGVDDEFSTEEFRMDNFNKLNSRESKVYNNNVYSNSYNNNNNGYSKTSLEGYTTKPEGMSDTRSLENGKYYYDTKNEYYNPNNGYYPVRENGNEEGYYNRKSKYEFDSMDEYEKREGYPDVQRDQYIP